MTFEIPGFTAIDVIGRGGFGVVHRAADEAHGRDVAVKILSRIDDDSARRRFDRERRAMGTLSGHPNIGIVYTSGFTDHNEPYIVMEMIRGGSLADRLERAGPMPAAEVGELGLVLAEALQVAHDTGVLHLDLKPENILMSRFGRPKIVDFGIAALVDDESRTGTIRATPAYADPTVLEGAPGTERSDVYGLAATMFTLLDGEPPYSKGPSGLYQVMRRVALDPVPFVDRHDVSRELSAFLRRAMDKDPARRPATMNDFARELRSIELEPVTVRRPAVGPVPSAAPHAAPPVRNRGLPAIPPLPRRVEGDPSGGAVRPPLPPAAQGSGPVPSVPVVRRPVVPQPVPHHEPPGPAAVSGPSAPPGVGRVNALTPQSFVVPQVASKRSMRAVLWLSIVAIVLGVVLVVLLIQANASDGTGSTGSSFVDRSVDEDRRSTG